MTVCIPAYQAGEFIDRTLRCAQGQTYGRLRILVSIDRSTDDTVSICRRFASLDRRMEVLEQNERLGWCGNVNALLDRIDTPFFFLYFHDDLILPQYCEQLRRALIESPEAASANCDLVDFGAAQAFKPGRAYQGSVAARLMTLWAVEERGTPLRSMTRRDRLDSDYRLPQEEKDSFTPGQTLLMRLVSAGPALRVPETLYLRWQRKGGLVDGWRQLPSDRLLAGWKNNLALAFPIIDQKVVEMEDRRALKFALTLFVLRSLSHRCLVEKRPLTEPKDLHPECPELEMPPNIERFGEEIAGWLSRWLRDLISLRSELA